MTTRGIGPKFLFWGTLVVVFVIGALSVFYFRAAERLQDSNKTIAQLKDGYEKKVEQLQKGLIVDQTKTITIPTQVVTTSCSNHPLSGLACTRFG